MIDKRVITAFLALSSTLHFGKASEQSHLSPSALTRMMQRLEDDLGVTLFERNSRTVVLTDQGRIYQRFARQFLIDLERLDYQLHGDDRLISGEIKIYCTVTASYIMMPDILRHFSHRYPNIKVRLETGSGRYGLDRLASNDVDAAVSVMGEVTPIGYLVKEILRTEMVCVAPAAFLGQTFAEVLQSLDFVMPEQKESQALIIKSFQALKQELKAHSYVDGNEAILSLVASGLGVSILPKAVIDTNHLFKDVVMIPLPEKIPDLRVGMFMKKAALDSPVKEKFWSTCLEIAK